MRASGYGLQRATVCLPPRHRRQAAVFFYAADLLPLITVN